MSESHSIQETSKKARTAFLWMASSSTIWQGLSWIFTIVVARILTPTDFGIFALLGTVAPYLALLATLKLDIWIAQEQDASPEKDAATFTLVAILSATLSLVCLVLAPVFAAFYEDPSLTPLYRWLALSILFQGLRVYPEATLKRDLEFRAIAIGNVAIGVVRNVVQVALALEGYGYWSLVIGMLFADFAGLVWLSIALGRLPRFGWNPKIKGRALRYGIVASAGTMLWTAGATSDEIAIGRFIDQETLGYYSMAYLLSELPLAKLNSVLSPVLIPYYSRLRSHREELEQAYLRITQGVVAVLGPAIAGVALVAPTLVPVVLGEHWEPMTPILQFLCILTLVRTIADNSSPFFFGIGRPDTVLRFTTVTTLLVVPAFFVLTPLYGMTGVYLAWTIFFPVAFAYSLYLLRKTVGISPVAFLGKVAVPFVAIGVMYAAVYGLRMVLPSELPGAAILVLEIMVGAIAYLGGFWLLFPRQARELISAFRSFRGSGTEEPA